MWEDIVCRRDEEVDWDQIAPMELANCKCGAVAKNILVLSVDNNWKPVNSFPGKGWPCMVGPLNIRGLL